MGTIGRRIDTAIKHLMDNDYENALIQLCIAIDATAKNKWPRHKPGKRIRQFVQEYEAFIYQFASAGRLVLTGSGNNKGKVSFSDDELPGILYKSIRCVLHHGDELADFVAIQEGNNLIGVYHGKISLNKGFIDGLLFSVVCDEINKQEFCDSLPTFLFGGTAIAINEAWGNLQEIEIRTGYKKVF